MSRSCRGMGWLAVVVTAVSAWAAVPAKSAEKARPLDAAFARLKSLAGDWQEANPKNPASKGKVVVRYRITAAGSAVEETIFPGDAHEMVTLYHRDGRDLILTHYCACGNQPRMRAKPGKDPNELFFDFAGGTNLDPAKDPHMHSCRMHVLSADHVRSDWQFYIKGQPAGIHTSDLVRKK